MGKGCTDELERPWTYGSHQKCRGVSVSLTLLRIAIERDVLPRTNGFSFRPS